MLHLCTRATAGSARWAARAPTASNTVRDQLLSRLTLAPTLPLQVRAYASEVPSQSQAPARSSPTSTHGPPGSGPGRSSVSGASPLTLTFLLLLALGGGYVAGTVYPPGLARLAFPIPAPQRLERHSPEGLAHCAEIERQLNALPIVQQLLARRSAGSAVGEKEERTPTPAPAISGQAGPAGALSAAPPSSPTSEPHYRVVRPYLRYPEERARNSLTAGTLKGPGLITVSPLVLTKTPHGAAAEGGAPGDAVALLHLGRAMCGHDGVVHGGLLATIFDEALARTAFHSLPSNVGVTARLEVDYRKPTMAEQVVRLHTWMTEKKGRKVTVQGELRALDGTLLAEARAIFVEPRFAGYINRKQVQEFLHGEEAA